MHANEKKKRFPSREVSIDAQNHKKNMKGRHSGLSLSSKSTSGYHPASP